SMRRSAVAESVEHEAEFFLLLIFGKPEHIENFRLQCPIMNSNRTGAEFVPIDDNIIRPRSDRGEVTGFMFPIFDNRRGEWMVHCIEYSRSLIEFEHWKIDNPERSKFECFSFRKF